MSCAFCQTKFPRGTTGPIFGISRQYLPREHPLRRQISGPYEYPAAELAIPAPLKDTAFVQYAAMQAQLQDLKHCMGQKGMPMFSDLANFVYEIMNIPDWAHNVSGLFKWIMTILVGTNGEGYAAYQLKKAKSRSDPAIRKQAQAHRIFPDIWPDKPTYLDADLAEILRGEYVSQNSRHHRQSVRVMATHQPAPCSHARAHTLSDCFAILSG